MLFVLSIVESVSATKVTNTIYKARVVFLTQNVLRVCTWFEI